MDFAGKGQSSRLPGQLPWLGLVEVDLSDGGGDEGPVEHLGTISSFQICLDS